MDDADEDGNTIYRGLAVPVDIRQVVEVSELDRVAVGSIIRLCRSPMGTI
jgi:hypothetical protein